MDRDEPTDVPPPTSVPGHLGSRVEAIVRAAEEEAGNIQREIEAQRRVAETEGRRYLVEARRQADALAEQRTRRLRELTDELIERAEATKTQFDGLIAALQRASANIESGLDVPAPPIPPRAPVRPPPPTPDVAARPRAGEAPVSLPAPAPSARAEALARATEAEAEMGEGDASEGSASGFTPPPAPPDYAGPAATGARPGAELDPATAPAAESQDARREDMGAARLVAIEMAVAGRTRSEVDRHLRDSFRITDTAELLDDVFGGQTGGDSSRRSWRGA
ncbi:MAG: hypothetical protein QOD76_228 [Solirubrobacteraceae bacterium]|jgi:hypothetical protein|nr:hypothetical protein [Solirubrobacteraceae bacterium]